MCYARTGQSRQKKSYRSQKKVTHQCNLNKDFHRESYFQGILKHLVRLKNIANNSLIDLWSLVYDDDTKTKQFWHNHQEDSLMENKQPITDHTEPQTSHSTQEKVFDRDTTLYF